MCALAGESDHLDMAETAVAEFDRIATLFDGTEYEGYRTAAVERKNSALRLVDSLQV